MVLRPFNESIHPRGWRSYQEYGNGTIGDMGIHMIDMARWMMDLGWPKPQVAWLPQWPAGSELLKNCLSLSK